MKKIAIVLVAIVVLGAGAVGTLYITNQRAANGTHADTQQVDQANANVPTPPNIDIGEIPIKTVAGSYQLVTDETIEKLRTASIPLREAGGGACAALKSYSDDWESNGHTRINENIATINQRMTESAERFGASDFHYIKGLNTLLASDVAGKGKDTCNIDGVDVMRIEVRYNNRSSTDRYFSSQTGGVPVPSKFDSLIRSTAEKVKASTPAITCVDPDGYGKIGCAAVLFGGRYEVIVRGTENNLEDCIRFLGMLLK